MSNGVKFKVIIDIKPISDGGRDCFESIMATILNWNGNNAYTLAYSESWGFGFKPEEPGNPGRLGDRLSPGWGSGEETLSKYNIIKWTWLEGKSALEALDIIEAELMDGYPVLIHIDPFYCPWFDIYKREHATHYCLVTGLTADGSPYCIDSVPFTTGCRIPRVEFVQGFEGCAQVRFGNNFIDIDWKSLLVNSVYRLQDMKAFTELDKFADELEKRFDLRAETENIKELWILPWFRELLNVRRGRENFSKLLSYLACTYNISDLHDISAAMRQIASKWALITSLLGKEFYRSMFSKDLGQRMASVVREIAQSEENLADAILQTTQNYCCGNNTSRSFEETNSLEYINTSLYVNNKAFSTGESDRGKADFTGVGQYFIAGGLKTGCLWDIENMKFLFPALSFESYDNISCKGQIIPIPPENYSSIMILGCSEWGSFSENIKITYNNGTTITQLIEFTDWGSEVPAYGEIIAWAGAAGDREKPGEESNREKGHIYAKAYPLKYSGIATAIHLPDNPNTHIFAITLGR